MSSPQAAAPGGRTRSGGIARVVGASLIGTTIEWYDYFLYRPPRWSSTSCSSPPTTRWWER